MAIGVLLLRLRFSFVETAIWSEIYGAQPAFCGADSVVSVVISG